MAFLIYKKYLSGANICYERLMPLQLGGRDGLIAHHVKAIPAANVLCWNLPPAVLLKHAGLAFTGTEFTVLFDATNYKSNCVCLYELIGIHGSCRDTSTQLALDFTILIDLRIAGNAAEYSRNFEIVPGNIPKHLGETLALSGGPGGGDWKWSETAMNLGVTVVSGKRTG